MASLRPLPRLLVLPLTALLASACTSAYTQQEGTYAFSATEEIVDDCGLLSAPDDLWDAQLLIAGETLRMDYGLFGQDGHGGIELVGYFLGVDDRFTVDGSVVNVSTVARGQQCLLDIATVHLEGRTDCPGEFSGTMRVRYESRRTAGCNCELWVRYRATQPGSTCAPAP